MRAFRYERDPLFLFSCALYALNRWGLKPTIGGVFLTNYFNDVLLLPCALPLLLWVHWRLGWRPATQPPSAKEIGLHWFVWSLTCEFLAPYFFHMGVSDPTDVLAYGAGGSVAWVVWNTYYAAVL